MQYDFIAVGLFIAGYVFISLEYRLHVSKAAVSLGMAVALWLVAGLLLPSTSLNSALADSGSSIFGLIIFFLTSMVLVEILVHYQAFDLIEQWMQRRQFSLRTLGFAVGLMVFFLSSFLANITVAIVGIQIAMRLFHEKHHLVIGCLIVIAANLGGAFSPIGDANTVMLWFAGKFSARQLISLAFVPCFAALMAASFVLLRKIPADTLAGKIGGAETVRVSGTSKMIIAASLGSFLLPLVVSEFHLPAYLGLLMGLAVVWLMIDVFRQVRPQPSHLDASLAKFLQRTDIESIEFYLGILLAVDALGAMGILTIAAKALMGAHPTMWRDVAAFVGLGAGSAIVDNVPLTAAAINTLHGISPMLWVLLAIAVTSGGALLVIGSAPGVMVMGMVREMSFGRYMKIGTWPALLAFATGIGVWAAEYALLIH